MGVGKEIRLRRFINEKGKTLIMPLDHGVEGTFDKLEQMDSFVKELSCKSDAFILRRGSIKRAYKSLINKASIIMRVTCTTTVPKKDDSTYEAFITGVEEGMRLGADALVATVWFGSKEENRSIEQFGHLADLCDRYEMPLIGECLIAPESGLDSKDEKANIIAARTLAEEGADIVKVLYTGSLKSFENVVNYCLVPVVTAGGDTSGANMDFLKDVEDMMKGGAIGTSIGRNIWNREDNMKILNCVDAIIKEGISAEKAFSNFMK